MSVRLGINPLTWTNDDMPALGAETSLDVCLSEGREAGFTGFELGNKFPRTPDTLGPILDGHGLSLVSGWYSSRLLERSVAEELAAIEDHLHLLASLGADVMVFCEVTGCVHGDRQTPVSHRPTLTDAQWERLTEGLEAVARHCLERGVRIAYHHHMGTVIESDADVRRLMDNTSDAVGLLLDTGHLMYAGGDAIEIQRAYAARICHVHCKDIRAEVLKDARNRDLSFLDAVLNGVFTVPGDGCIDYPTLFQGLKANDYSGWLVVEAEQDPAVAHPLTYARLGYRHLKQFCERTGLVVEA
ncbi:myo-inosose-2 dehydratase [Saccharospirillum salsuginis]|uniref:Myo-inosose-2 dehydratase n=1 Tax=Saccharospirillum salsuginis TaxID=418750 RepID=A0A918NG74_9GAMM|nr:myo-inosose-2 dehydratase [Saccharospirillum salsuginis]GGX65116.1 myo-inosose-2 dehydratase [Saccharospirillum salsuginis]